MGDESVLMKEFKKYLQFPVAVLAALQAGSIFYVVEQFNFIKEKYNISDDIFDWYDFTMNASALCGIVPGLLIIWLKPKTCAVLGGILIAIGQLLSVTLVVMDHQHITNNSQLYLFLVCLLSGQGSIMVILSILQSLVNTQTIQSTAVICTCIFSYYLGADSFIQSIKNSLLPEMEFQDFMMILVVSALISAIANGILITDEEDAGGFLGKAVALSKGIIFKKVNYLNLIILMAYTVLLILNLDLYDLKSVGISTSMLILVILNLFVPVFLIALIAPENIKDYVGEPSHIEKKLSNKGEDMKLSQAAGRGDFWYNCLTAFTVIGGARMLEENAQVLALGDEKTAEEINQAFLVFEVVGALVAGIVLIFFREFCRPSAALTWVLLLQVFGFALMIRPDAIGFVAKPILLTVKISAACEGAFFTSFGVFIHEEYGTAEYGLILSIFMTFGFLGLYLLDLIFFPNILEMFKDEVAKNQDYFKVYGQWNQYMFSSLTILAVLGLLVTFHSLVAIRKLEKINENTLKIIEF